MVEAERGTCATVPRRGYATEVGGRTAEKLSPCDRFEPIRQRRACPNVGDSPLADRMHTRPAPRAAAPRNTYVRRLLRTDAHLGSAPPPIRFDDLSL